jgi:hypothetical protein
MNWSLRTTVVLALLALLLAGLAACGGNDDDDADPFDPGSGDQSDDNGDDGSGDDDGDDGGSEDDGDDDGFDFGTGTAVVTVGDNRYEFDLTAGFVVCRDVFDAIQVSGPSAADENVSLDAWIPPTDWESFDDGRYDPPQVTIEDDTNDAKWVADQARVELLPDFPEESRVDSYEKDGMSAAGTATFIDEYALLRGDPAEPVQGTFEIACAEE